ncbi:hypothetical protein Tco_1568775 [Tanacetum coccineum]
MNDSWHKPFDKDNCIGCCALCDASGDIVNECQKLLHSTGVSTFYYASDHIFRQNTSMIGFCKQQVKSQEETSINLIRNKLRKLFGKQRLSKSSSGIWMPLLEDLTGGSALSSPISSVNSLVQLNSGNGASCKDNGFWRLSDWECYYFKGLLREDLAASGRLHEMTPVSISSGLVPNPLPSTPFVPPSRSDWDLLFQPMFNESLNPPPYVDLQAPEVIAPILEAVAPEHTVLTGLPSLTTVDQDAPSPSNSHTTQETQTPIISHNVEEDNHDIEVVHMGHDPYYGIPIPEFASNQSSSSDVIHTILPLDHQVSEHNSKWTKDHPLENIISNLDRLISTRLQLHEQAIFSYYDAFLTSVEPKNYKDALTQACWIEAMQEELHEFERLKVWELVPPPDKALNT